MRRLVSVLTVLVPALASAQPGAVEPLPPDAIAPAQSATDPNVLSLARGTYSAAARGDCVGARVLGSQIARLDPEFHRTVIKTDPVITQCRPAARQYSVVAADEAAGAHLPAREGYAPASGGLLVGEFLVGGLFTIGGGIAGAYLGAALEDNNGCSDECWGGLLLGGFIGGTLMAAVGVNLVGDTDEADGSLGLTIGGSVLGGLLGVGALANSDSGQGGLFILVAAPTIGAMLGHNLSRRYTPRRAPSGPTYDRRLALQPSQRLEGNTGVTFATGSF